MSLADMRKKNQRDDERAKCYRAAYQKHAGFAIPRVEPKPQFVGAYAKDIADKRKEMAEIHRKT